MNLEENVISTVHSAITEAIKAKLASGYNSPLDALIKASVDKHSPAIQGMMDKAIQDALTGDFATALADACTRKLAKVIIQKMEGEIEKKANDLRGSPEFRAKLTLAVSEVISSIGKP